MPIAHEDIIIGTQVVRDGEENGERFDIVRTESILTKDSSASNWHPAVVYRSQIDPDIHLVRTVTDFGAKFSLWIEPTEEDEEAE